MFKLFKKKLKDAINLFSKKAEQETKEQEEVVEHPAKEVKEKTRKETTKQQKERKEQKKEREKKEKKDKRKQEEKQKKEKHEPKQEPVIEPTEPEPQEKLEEPQREEEKEKQLKEEKHEPPKEKKSFFRKLKEKVTHTRITKEQFDKLFWDLEITLLENNVALEVIEKIKQDLEAEIIDKPIRDISKTIQNSLRNSISEALTTKEFNIIQEIKSKKTRSQGPYIIVFVGTNGSGKTTTIAKISHLLKKNNITSMLVAADTWRSAAIEQLEIHSKKLKVPLIKTKYGADPAAVAFDGIAMAKARKIDAVLIDTAGRQHSNTNLLQEMEKIIRVTKPDLKIFIGESITGNDCIEQIKQFNQTIGINGIILTKADVDEKGGTAISTSYVSKKPILYLGTGQSYDDLKPFNKQEILRSLDLG
ncbi:MAG: signal recognition particle-docking protein FtsY [Nanoarchaeota archaeon]|nr:signal recognition particle-docking protein FtsY [Nanoarchaeota archaeon]